MTTLTPTHSDAPAVRPVPRLALFATAAAQFALMLGAFGVLSSAIGWPQSLDLPAAGFAALIAQEAKTAPARPRALSGLLLHAVALLSPMIRELADIQYQMVAPFTVDGTRLTSTFGIQPTPHRAAIRQTLAWLHAGFS